MQDVEQGVEEVSTAVNDQVSILKEWINGFTDGALTMGVKVIFAILLFLVGRFILKLILKVMDKALDRSSVDVTVTQFLNYLLKAAGYIIIGLLSLGILGYEATSFAAILGSVGVAVGLAIQGSLSNFAGGVLILLIKPYRVGDYIIEGGNEGTVRSIGLVYTELVTVDNKLIVIPNGAISNDRLVNVSAMPQRRVDVDLTVSYQADLAVVKRTLLAVLSRQELLLADRDLEVAICELADNGVKIQCRCWCETENYWTVKGELTEKFKNALDEAQMPIVYSMTNVNILSKDALLSK